MFKKKEKDPAIVIAKKPKKKIKKRYIVLAVVLVLIVIMAVRCSAAANTPQMVDVTEVKKGDVSATLDTSGTIASEVSKVYASPVTAAVGDVNIKVGDAVAAGDYLVTYDTTSLQENYDLASLEAKANQASESDSVTKSNQGAQDKANAESTIADLQAQLDTKNTEINTLNGTIVNYQQQSNDVTAQMQQYSAGAQAGTLSADQLQAYEDLKKRSNDLANALVSAQMDAQTKQTELAAIQSKMSEAQSKKSTAEASILSGSAKANLDYSTEKTKLSVSSAENDLSKAQAGVVADFDGVITSVDITSGAVAQEGQSLFTVASAQDMKVEFKVSKYNLKDLQVGQKATITFLDKKYEGSITSIGHVAAMTQTGSGTSTSTSAMVTAVVHIDNPDDSLIIGLDAKVSVELGTSKNVVEIPLSAVNTNKDGDFVYVVEDGIVKKKTITTGLTSSEMAEVTEGLKEGEQVISTVDSTIVEGAYVVANPVDNQ